MLLDTGDLSYALSKTIGDRNLLELRFIRYMEKLLWRMADAIFVRGTYFKTLLLQKGYKNVHFIPEGVDIEEIKSVRIR